MGNNNNIKNKYKMMSIDKIVKNSINIVLVGIILAIKGCYNFVTLTWKWDRIFLVSYWVDILTQLILLAMIKMIAYNIFIDKARYTNTTLQYEITRNERLLKLREHDFPEWVENDLNRQIKIEAWKNLIHKRLAKNEKRAKAEDRALWYNKDEFCQEQKQQNKYCKNRATLELLLTDDWIKENYFSLPFKSYERIDAATFDVPVVIDNNSSQYQLKAKTKTAIATSLFTSSFGLVMWQSIMRLVGYDADQTILLASIINLLLDMVIMLQQFGWGVISAYQIVSKQEVIPYINRNRILEQYLRYKRPDAQSTLDKIIEDINKASDVKNSNKEGA